MLLTNCSINDLIPTEIVRIVVIKIMLSMSVKIKYGLCVMLELAKFYNDKPLRLPFLAEIHSIPQTYLEQVFAELKRSASDLASSLESDGTLLCSGILDKQVAELEETFRMQDLVPSRSLTREGWSAIEFQRAFTKLAPKDSLFTMPALKKRKRFE